MQVSQPRPPTLGVATPDILERLDGGIVWVTSAYLLTYAATFRHGHDPGR